MKPNFQIVHTHENYIDCEAELLSFPESDGDPSIDARLTFCAVDKTGDERGAYLIITKRSSVSEPEDLISDISLTWDAAIEMVSEEVAAKVEKYASGWESVRSVEREI